MKNTNLLNIDEEPTEEALAMLMHEVINDVKERAIKTKNELTEKILFEIEKAESRIEKRNFGILENQLSNFLKHKGKNI